MTPERWSQIKELLQSALEREPQQQADFLTQACSGDRELRNQVESLLAVREQAQAFIEAPALEIAAPILAASQSLPNSGQLLGPYRILRPLGRGGMGEIYLAYDGRLNRQVAIKLLPRYATRDADLVRRFKREAHAASALNHPNIITIHEIGEVDERDFIVTEYIEGETLRQRIKRAPIGWRDLLDIAVQIASALAAAHAARIIHRDIKPDNVIIRRDGFVKVLDFGLAKLTEPLFEHRGAAFKETVKDLGETEPGMILGTVSYMSPEQAQALPVDTRTDIWSLGVVIFEMACGRVPFSGANMSQVIAAILREDPAPLSDLMPDVPPELQRIVSKALRKDREERYQSVNDLLVDLRSLKQELEFAFKFRGSEAESTKEIDTKLSGDQLASWSKKSRVVIILAALVILALILGVVSNLYRRSDLVTTKGGEAQEDKLRRTLKGHTQAVRAIAFSPDSKALASGGYDGKFQLWDLASGTSRWSKVEPGAVVSGVAFSPDGEKLAIAMYGVEGGGRVDFFDTRSGEPNKTVPPPKDIKDPIGSIAFSPDGQSLFGTLGSHGIIWDLKTGKLASAFEAGANPVFVVSRDGNVLALASSEQDNVKLYDTQTGKLLRTLAGHKKGLLAVAFSPTGQTLAAGGYEGTTLLWDAATGATLQSFKDETDAVFAVAFVPDGQAVATGGSRSVRLWDLRKSTPKQTFSVEDQGIARALAFSSDGVTLASGCENGAVILFEVR